MSMITEGLPIPDLVRMMANMKPQQAFLMGALVALTSFGCGEEDVVNGFATYGSGKVQGFVTGLYELEATSYAQLDQSPFTDSLIPCRITVGQSLADTVVQVRFAPPGQAAVPVTVNLVVSTPAP